MTDLAMPPAQLDLRAAAALSAQAAPLRVHNLLNDLRALAPLLVDQLRQSAWLDAYLLAAGMNQIVEDYLHPDSFLLGRAAKYLTQLGAPPGLFAARIAQGLSAVIARLHAYQPETRRVMRWQTDWAAFTQQLANLVADATGARADTQRVVPKAELVQSGEALVAQSKHFPPRLLDAILRLPSCFRGFDQQPADLERMVREFSQRFPDRRKPLVVVGIRTSGSYLAPLLAAFLQANDYPDVRVMTLRPERRLFAAERALLQRAIQQDGLVLVTDDPPVTGSAMYKSLKELERLGVPGRAIVLLLQLFGVRDTMPRLLQQYVSVLVPWDEWHIHAQLAPRAIQAALTGLVSETRFLGKKTGFSETIKVQVTEVERLPLPPRKSPRSHVHALYRARLVDSRTGAQWDQRVFVKGVGLGYFGAYSLAVAEKLHDFLPTIYGLHAGLFYQAWLPEERRVTAIAPGQAHALAAPIAAYVAARHRALALDEDIGARLFGESPAWEVASNLLSRVYGSAWPFMRILVVDPIVKHLLRVEHPSVVDGRMPLSHWFVDDAGAGLLKTDFDEGTFSNAVELTSYDSVFELASLVAHCDLAGATPDQVDELARHLRATYTRLARAPVDAERWLLYQLVHLWDVQHTDSQQANRVRRASARAMQRYFAEVFFRDLPLNQHPSTRSAQDAALCAIDIDGVLEASLLGFPGLTPTGALTLRALATHGYRPVLATGRCLDEVRERCHAYRLAGGVAEYGAVVYNRQAERVVSLLSERDRADLDRLRSVLSRIEGVFLDDEYRYAVRGYRYDPTGRRRSLDLGTITAALADAGMLERIRPIVGQAQTDFMVIGIDKGAGLRVLAQDLGVDDRANDAKPLAFAVGDASPDLPMFELAACACAPANADAAVRNAGVKVMSRPYQRGLAQAAALLLGHFPGSCALCRVPPLSADAHLLNDLLAAPEVGRWGRLGKAILLSLRATR